MTRQLLTELQKGVFRLTLNRSEKLNSIGFAMLKELEEALQEAEEEAAVKVILIDGSGPKAFSAGGNIQEFAALQGGEINRWIEWGNALFNRLEQFNKPTVAYIDGYALGGGLELALSCDFRLGTERAVLGSPEVSNGWLPGWGGMARLRRLAGEAVAKEVVLLGEKIPAPEAHRLGLLTRLLSPGHEAQELEQFVERLLSLSPEVYALAKTALMDTTRTTTGTDVQFDVLAVQIARSATVSEP
jgi:enoyl-CoA hydratase/carnithine racemase